LRRPSPGVKFQHVAQYRIIQMIIAVPTEKTHCPFRRLWIAELRGHHILLPSQTNFGICFHMELRSSLE
jgi:hypothetical protein